MSWSIDDHDHAADRLEYERIRARFPGLVTRGFECMGGWHPLLEKMFAEIREAIPEGQEALFDLRQVKEKFGGLRVYCGLDKALPKEVHHRVDLAVTLAEFRADRTCEVCGSHGWHLVRGQPQGWHMTRCLAHADGGLPLGEPSRRRGALEYDEILDEVVELSALSLADLLEREAERLDERIDMALIGNFRGMSDEFDRLSWPGWEDPVPAHLRGHPQPWKEVRPFLDYQTPLRSGFHPVTAWTNSRVLTLRRDINGRPLVIAVPRYPSRYEQELWS